MINNSAEKFNSDLGFGAWDNLIDNPNLRNKKVPQNNRNQQPINKQIKTVPTNNLNKTNNVKPINIPPNKNLNNSKQVNQKKANSNFKKIPKFDLNGSLFLNKSNRDCQIVVDILVKDDYDLIVNFKKPWFFFIPLIGLILFIWITNRMFRSFRLNISRTLFNSNGLSNVVIIGCILVSMMFATIATFLVCVFLLGLFNNLAGSSSIISFIGVLLAIVIIFLLLIDYCFVILFCFYVHPKIKNNYRNDISRALVNINWNNTNSILKVLDGD